MTAILTFSDGRPTFDWEVVLQDVLANGIFGTDVGTAVLTSGSGAFLTLTGDSALTTVGDRTITGGNILQFVLDDGAGHTMTMVYSGGMVSLLDLTNIMGAVIGLDP